MTKMNSRLVVALAVIVFLSAMAGTISNSERATSSHLTIEATTTETNAPVNAMAYEQQPIQLHFEYSGLGSGTHDMELREEETFGNDDTIRDFTVEGDSGSKTFHLSAAELASTKESGPEDAAHLYIQWGEEGKSNTIGLWWVDTTVYTKGYGKLPDKVEHGEEVTIEYYGWTTEQQTHVRLVEDDPALNSDSGGNDEQIRRDTVSGTGQFEGSFTFTPSDYVGDGEEGDGAIEVQSRQEGERHYPDLVREIEVETTTPTPTATPTQTERPTKIDARITDFSPSSGAYRAGDDVTSRVEVENTGNTRHTFFVGYGVVDEDGNSYDNDGTTGTEVTLDPGERTTVTVAWTVEEDVPAGSYGAGTAVWKESNRDDLETRLDDRRVQNAFEVVPKTDTSTVTPASASEDDQSGRDQSADDQSGGDQAGDDGAQDDTPQANNDVRTVTVTENSGPGFGPVAALIALISAAALVRVHRGWPLN